MRSPHAFLLLGLTGFLLGSTSLAAQEAAGKAAVEIVRPEGKRTEKEASLKAGMAAAEVRAILGTPQKIDPLQAPSGDAEIWTYTTQTEISRERFQVGSRPITTLVRDSNGREREQVIGEEPLWGTKKRLRTRTYQVLLFNGQFLNDKVSEEEKQVMD